MNNLLKPVAAGGGQLLRRCSVRGMWWWLAFVLCGVVPWVLLFGTGEGMHSSVDMRSSLSHGGETRVPAVSQDNDIATPIRSNQVHSDLRLLSVQELSTLKAAAAVFLATQKTRNAPRNHTSAERRAPTQVPSVEADLTDAFGVARSVLASVSIPEPTAWSRIRGYATHGDERTLRWTGVAAHTQRLLSCWLEIISSRSACRHDVSEWNRTAATELAEMEQCSARALLSVWRSRGNNSSRSMVHGLCDLAAVVNDPAALEDTLPRGATRGFRSYSATAVSLAAQQSAYVQHPRHYTCGRAHFLDIGIPEAVFGATRGAQVPFSSPPEPPGKVQRNFAEQDSRVFPITRRLRKFFDVAPLPARWLELLDTPPPPPSPAHNISAKAAIDRRVPPLSGPLRSLLALLERSHFVDNERWDDDDAIISSSTRRAAWRPRDKAEDVHLDAIARRRLSAMGLVNATSVERVGGLLLRSKWTEPNDVELSEHRKRGQWVGGDVPKDERLRLEEHLEVDFNETSLPIAVRDRLRAAFVVSHDRVKQQAVDLRISLALAAGALPLYRNVRRAVAPFLHPACDRCLPSLPASPLLRAHQLPGLVHTPSSVTINWNAFDTEQYWLVHEEAVQHARRHMTTKASVVFLLRKTNIAADKAIVHLSPVFDSCSAAAHGVVHGLLEFGIRVTIVTTHRYDPALRKPSRFRPRCRPSNIVRNIYGFDLSDEATCTSTYGIQFMHAEDYLVNVVDAWGVATRSSERPRSSYAPHRSVHIFLASTFLDFSEHAKTIQSIAKIVWLPEHLSRREVVLRHESTARYVPIFSRDVAIIYSGTLALDAGPLAEHCKQELLPFFTGSVLGSSDVPERPIVFHTRSSSLQQVRFHWSLQIRRAAPQKDKSVHAHAQPTLGSASSHALDARLLAIKQLINASVSKESRLHLFAESDVATDLMVDELANTNQWKLLFEHHEVLSSHSCKWEPSNTHVVSGAPKAGEVAPASSRSENKRAPLAESQEAQLVVAKVLACPAAALAELGPTIAELVDLTWKRIAEDAPNAVLRSIHRIEEDMASAEEQARDILRQRVTYNISKSLPDVGHNDSDPTRFRIVIEGVSLLIRTKKVEEIRDRTGCRPKWFSWSSTGDGRKNVDVVLKACHTHADAREAKRLFLLAVGAGYGVVREVIAAAPSQESDKELAPPPQHAGDAAATLSRRLQADASTGVVKFLIGKPRSVHDKDVMTKIQIETGCRVRWFRKATERYEVHLESCWSSSAAEKARTKLLQGLGLDAWEAL